MNAPASAANRLFTETVPTVFYNDHAARDLPAGEVITEWFGKTTVRATAEEWSEILSDAEFYADGMADNEPALSASAARLVAGVGMWEQETLEAIVAAATHSNSVTVVERVLRRRADHQ